MPPAEGRAYRYAHVVLPIYEQVGEQVRVHIVRGEAESQVAIDVDVEAAASADEPLRVSLMAGRERDFQHILEHKDQLWGKRNVCGLVDSSEARPRKKGHRFPLAQVELRPRSKDIGRRREAH